MWGKPDQKLTENDCLKVLLLKLSKQGKSCADLALHKHFSPICIDKNNDTLKKQYTILLI